MFLFEISINKVVLHFGLCLFGELLGNGAFLVTFSGELKPNHEVFPSCFDAVSGCVALPGKSV